MSEPIIELLDQTWRSISDLGHSLTDDQWAISTECPGWSTKDIVSHLIGIERKLLGLPDDPPAPSVSVVREKRRRPLRRKCGRSAPR